MGRSAVRRVCVIENLEGKAIENEGVAIERPWFEPVFGVNRCPIVEKVRERTRIWRESRTSVLLTPHYSSSQGLKP